MVDGCPATSRAIYPLRISRGLMKLHGCRGWFYGQGALHREMGKGVPGVPAIAHQLNESGSMDVDGQGLPLLAHKASWSVGFVPGFLTGTYFPGGFTFKLFSLPLQITFKILKYFACFQRMDFLVKHMLIFKEDKHTTYI